MLLVDFITEIIATINKLVSGCESGYPNYLNVFTICLLIIGVVVFALVKKILIIDFDLYI